MYRIGIVEDDKDLQEGLAISLRSEGYEIKASGTLAGARRLADGCDLLILDENLPDGSGFDLCAQLREASQTPILMLTARDTEMDEVRAFAVGADDFVSKPFSLAVLKARIRKLLERRQAGRRLISGGITVDRDSCKVYRGGEEIACSRTEYQILTFFLENVGHVVSKEQILSYVWDSQGRFVDENAVFVNIRRLRAKIEKDPKNPQRIRTVHGIGYIWKEET